MRQVALRESFESWLPYLTRAMIEGETIHACRAAGNFWRRDGETVAKLFRQLTVYGIHKDIRAFASAAASGAADVPFLEREYLIEGHVSRSEVPERVILHVCHAGRDVRVTGFAALAEERERWRFDDAWGVLGADREDISVESPWTLKEPQLAATSSLVREHAALAAGATRRIRQTEMAAGYQRLVAG